MGQPVVGAGGTAKTAGNKQIPGLAVKIKNTETLDFFKPPPSLEMPFESKAARRNNCSTTQKTATQHAETIPFYQCSWMSHCILKGFFHIDET